ncbi:tetratricopeptide repeat protein 27-like isoform X2 [Halichondria panicea]|uniref:tetratricopeptide repeat protein 27-like isoform X2 n=1 Tax=Halichondria panicea TaxID=6063 RepID=UPI00312B6D8C
MRKTYRLGFLLSWGAGLLDLFCRLNWTGPPLTSDGETTLAELSRFNNKSLDILSWDSETSYHLSQCPTLLVLSHLLLDKWAELVGGKKGEEVFAGERWRVRCLFIQQRLLSQRSESLWKRISQSIDEHILPELEGKNLPTSDLIELYLELGHMYLYYSDLNHAQEFFKRALDLFGMETDLSGSLGKRTKFQQKDIAQLILQVTISDNKTIPTAPPTNTQTTSSHSTPSQASLPQDVALGDDTLLDNIEFVDQPSQPQLSHLQQAVVLGECLLRQKSMARQRLTNEELGAYIRCVLSHPSCWVVQFRALYTRSLLEKTLRRKVERAMMQLQYLVDYVGKGSGAGVERMFLFYCVPMPPRWILERQLAQVLVSLGSHHSALEIYERLQLWEDIITCYQATGRKGRAEEIVREKLQEKETPTMLCLLGDLTNDPQHYKRAWEVSNNHSARAQRALGLYHLRREEYHECIESLQLSLKVNAMQDGLWFSLGCAASKVGDVDLEVKAFHRSVTLEPDFPEAWSNLGSAYLKKKETVKAYHVYKEAVKYGYSNWNIWDNFLVVCAEVGAFGDAIRAYHRLMDLRDKYVDVGVLRVLVTAVNDNLPDFKKQPADLLRGKLGELLGRLCASTTVGCEVWHLYATYHFASDDPLNQEKGLIEMQKAQRAVRQEADWDKDEQKLGRVVQFTIDYCQACRRVSALRGSDQRKLSLSNLSSAKLVLQSLLSKAKGFGLTEVTSVQLIIEHLENELKSVLSSMTELDVNS